MRLSRFAGIMFLVLVAFATFAVTSTVAGRIKKARKARDGRAPITHAVAPDQQITGRIWISNQPRANQMPAPTTIASGTMQAFGAEAIRKAVHVIARAYIYDKRDGMKYVWVVRVYKPDNKKKILFEKRYSDQLFGMQANMEMTPTFEDVIHLPLDAGTYMIEATAFMITPQRGLAGLDDPAFAEGSRGPTGRQRVTITD